MSCLQDFQASKCITMPSSCLDKSESLGFLLRYIHRNPLRAGMVETLNEYAWSSHHGYLSLAKNWNWLHKDFILSMLAYDQKKRKQAYLRFMAKDDSDELLDLFEQKKWPSLLGSENFISWVKETFFEKKKHRQVPESVQLAPDQEKIKREVCRAYGITGYSPAGSAVERIKKKLSKDRKLLKRIEKIKQFLFAEKGQNET